LVTGRRLEADLKSWRGRWTQIAQDVGHRSVARQCTRARASLATADEQSSQDRRSPAHANTG
jgi:hypothetical protein